MNAYNYEYERIFPRRHGKCDYAFRVRKPWDWRLSVVMHRKLRASGCG